MKTTHTGERDVPSHAPPQRPNKGLAVPPELAQFRFGRSPLVAFAEIVTELASRGIYDKDDATRLYLWFRAGQEGASGQGVGSLPVQASKLRKFIALGRVCRDEGVELIRRAKAIHAEIYRSSGRERLKLTSTYSALVAVARAQLDRMAGGGRRMLTDAEIRSVLLG
jgi:hypothetical protein